MNEVRTGALIVATHDLVDPNFAKAVVLLLDHDEDGTIGVVLNRPSAVPVTDPLPDCRHRMADPAVVFAGGPVGRDTMLVIGTGEVGPSPAWQQVTDGIGLVDIDQDAPTGLEASRVFAGYAGWSPGQLEAEVGAGAWWVLDGPSSEVLATQPFTLWRRMLKAQGGLFTTVPDDPVLN
jgi:putative transcriptional regulator